MAESKIFSLNSNDFIRSAFTAVFAAVVVALGGIVSQPGFDVFAVDWHHVLNLVLNVGISTFIGDVARRLATDKDGAVLGKFGGTK